MGRWVAGSEGRFPPCSCSHWLPRPPLAATCLPQTSGRDRPATSCPPGSNRSTASWASEPDRPGTPAADASSTSTRSWAMSTSSISIPAHPVRSRSTSSITDSRGPTIWSTVTCCSVARRGSIRTILTAAAGAANSGFSTVVAIDLLPPSTSAASRGRPWHGARCESPGLEPTCRTRC